MKAQLAIATLLIAGTVVAQDEQGNRPPPPPRGEGGFIAHFDKDGDGKVSQNEFKGPAEHFTTLDKNGDGFIGADEGPKGPPSRRGEEGRRGPQADGRRAGGFVAHFDQDGDGKVSKEEFTGPEEHFTRMDKNGDGFIGADEAPKGPPPREGAGRPGQPHGEEGGAPQGPPPPAGE